MLSAVKRTTATEIAKGLANEGMIWGYELDKFITAEEYNGFLRFQNNDEREAFINRILEWVQCLWDKVLVVYDLVEDISKIYLSRKEIYLDLNTSDYRVGESIKTGIYINKRYKVSKYKPKIKEVSEGLYKIDGQVRKGNFS